MHFKSKTTNTGNCRKHTCT